MYLALLSTVIPAAVAVAAASVREASVREASDNKEPTKVLVPKHHRTQKD